MLFQIDTPRSTDRENNVFSSCINTTLNFDRRRLDLNVTSQVILIPRLRQEPWHLHRFEATAAFRSNLTVQLFTSLVHSHEEPTEPASLCAWSFVRMTYRVLCAVWMGQTEQSNYLIIWNIISPVVPNKYDKEITALRLQRQLRKKCRLADINWYLDRYWQVLRSFLLTWYRAWYSQQQWKRCN